MGRQVGSVSSVSSTITIKFNSVQNDPFIEGSKTEAYGDAIYKVVFGTLGLTSNSDVNYYYSKRTQQAIFVVNYKTSNGAEKAALIASFIAGAEISIESSKPDAVEEVSEAPKKQRGRAPKAKTAKVAKVAKAASAKRGPGRPKKGFTKNGKKLGRPVGSKNVAAASETVAPAETVAPIAAEQQNLAVDIETTLTALREMLKNAPVAAETETVTENATVTA